MLYERSLFHINESSPTCYWLLFIVTCQNHLKVCFYFNLKSSWVHLYFIAIYWLVLNLLKFEVELNHLEVIKIFYYLRKVWQCIGVEGYSLEKCEGPLEPKNPIVLIKGLGWSLEEWWNSHSEKCLRRLNVGGWLLNHYKPSCNCSLYILYIYLLYKLFLF